MTENEIDLIIEATDLIRKDLGDLFLSAQVNLGIKLDERRPFEVIARHSDDKLAFKDVLLFCKKNPSLLKEVVQLIIDYKMYKVEQLPVLQGIINTLTQLLSDGNGLQAIINRGQGMKEPVIDGKELLKWSRWIGKIMIDGNAMGSGVLIDRDLFLTCWHTVKEFFTFDHLTGKYIPQKRVRNLVIVFDDHLTDVDGVKKRSTSREVMPAADWLDCFSPFHDEELYQRLPECSLLDDHLDYAAIRLSEKADISRSYAKLDERAGVPAVGKWITVVHHAGGGHLKYTGGELVAGECFRYRFHHRANTGSGSSGGPCFDADLNLIGLHQSSRKKMENGCILNCGIPMVRIIKHMAQQKPNSVVFAEKITYQPVFGIDRFKTQIFENIRTSKRNSKGNLLTIQGKKGSGKSFLIECLYTFLNSAEHLRVHLSAEAISKMDPVTLARHICREASAESEDIEDFDQYIYRTASAKREDMADLTPFKNADNATTWLREEVVHKVMAALQAKRREKMVWISICNMNIFEVEDRFTAEMLLLMFECVTQYNWLQFILDDYKKSLPGYLSGVSQVHELQDKTQNDLHQYIDRFLMELNIIAPDGMSSAFAFHLFNQYQEDLLSNSETALSRLNASFRILINEFLNRTSQFE